MAPQEPDRAANPSWWLEGDQTCGFCSQLHWVEHTCYCWQCDAPLCRFCAIEVRSDQSVSLVCPHCQQPNACG